MLPRQFFSAREYMMTECEVYAAQTSEDVAGSVVCRFLNSPCGAQIRGQMLLCDPSSPFHATGAYDAGRYHDPGGCTDRKPGWRLL